MLISFSGPDGAGKTTQIKKLMSYFRDRGFEVGAVQDINPDVRYHLGDDLSGYYEYLKQFDVIHTRFRLHSMENVEIMDIVQFISTGNKWLTSFSAYTSHHDAEQWYKYVTAPLLKDGKILISDKYAFDDIAFKTAYGCEYTWLRALHHDTQIPDISLYLKVNRNTILQHNEHRKDLKNILYQKAENTEKLLEAFDQLTMDYPLHAIEANGSREEVFSNIMSYLESIPAFRHITNKG
uniref:dTMP kinase n=1 Tax=Acetatifactor sp. TaxID=1872090 RepID=UPI004055F73E